MALVTAEARATEGLRQRGFLQTKGLNEDFFTCMFAIARVSGWLAHWLEQIKANKLFRPDQIYDGRHGRVDAPIERRANEGGHHDKGGR
ncbi:citrate/2-methylcitrate synthase [Candidatus Nitrospira bockiana]